MTILKVVRILSVPSYGYFKSRIIFKLHVTTDTYSNLHLHELQMLRLRLKLKLNPRARARTAWNMLHWLRGVDR